MDTSSLSPEVSETTNETTTPETNAAPVKRRRGFACMTPEKRAEISQLGGRAAHAQGRAHRFTAEEARQAGKLGGVAPRRKREKATAPIETH